MRVQPEVLTARALCMVAAVRVSLFSVAFPVFDNVDEPAHYDLVSK